MSLSKLNILFVSGGWHYDFYVAFRNILRYLMIIWCFGLTWVATLQPKNYNYILFKEISGKTLQFSSVFWGNSGKTQGILFRKSCTNPAAVDFPVKATFFRENNFICSRGVKRLVNSYFWFFQGLIVILPNLLMIRTPMQDTFSSHMSRNRWEGVQFSFNLGELRNIISK